MLEIEILVKTHSPTAFLNGYSNIAIFYSDFFLAKYSRWEWLSRVRMRYRKTVGEWKDTENDIYANDSPNNDLENEI